VAFDREDALRKAEKYLRLGRLDGAISEYQRVVDAVPHDWKTLNALADLYLRVNQPDRATALFARIAAHLSAEGFLSRAEAFYKRILKVSPDDEAALEALATLAIKQGILVEAKGYLATIARARHSRGDTRGVTEIQLRIQALEPRDLDGRLKDARDAAEAGAVQVAADSLLQIASELVADGRTSDAVAVLSEAVHVAPDDDRPRAQLRPLVLATRHAEAVAALCGSAQEALALAEEFDAASWKEGAERAWSEAIRHDVADPALASRLFRHAMERGRLSDAQRFAWTADACVLLAQAFESAADLDGAVGALERADSLDAGRQDVVVLLARLHARCGSFEAATKILPRIRGPLPSDLSLLQIAEWLRSGEQSRAREAIVRGLDLGEFEGSLVASTIDDLASASADAAWPALEAWVDWLNERGEGQVAVTRLHDFLDRHGSRVAPLVKLVELAVEQANDLELSTAQAALVTAYLSAGLGAEARVIAEDLVSRAPAELEGQELLRRALAMTGDPDPAGTVKEFATQALALLDLLHGGLAGQNIPLASEPHSPETVKSPQLADAGPRRSDPFALGPGAIDVESLLEPERPSGEDAGEDHEPPEIDLTEVLKELRPSRRHTGGRGKGTRMPDRPEPSNLDEVFRDFREEVSRQTAADQAERHYKVALTYRDMGMLDDAVRELEQAARAPRLRFEASSLLARLLKERGDQAGAIEWFERAAEAPAPTPEAGRELLYELGQTLETAGEVARALAVYLELQADTADYRDVTARVERLSRVQAES
jgi:tetratricopeptide (TPR) repeat protein